MRFALLGMDDNVLAFAKQVAGDDRHPLTVAVVHPSSRARARELAPRIAVDWQWEDLLGTSNIDAVVVAGTDEQELHDEQLRKLAQAGVPLIVSHPSCTAIFAYELDMIRTDVGGLVMPLFAGPPPEMVSVVRQAIASGEAGPIGVVTRLDIETHLAVSDERTFLQCLALDAHLVSAVLGPVENVSAIGGSPDGSYQNVTVHMSNNGPLAARWAVTQSPGRRLRLVGTTGEATLHSAGETWKWQTSSSSPGSRDMELRIDPALATIQELERVLSGGQPTDAWQDACSDLEVAETALVSLRRKRTMDVYSDPRTEEDSFKGVMAIGSCALLLLVLLSFVFLAVYEGIRLPLTDTPVVGEADEIEPKRWPLLVRLWPVYPLLAFLALQGLLVFTKSRRRKSANG